MEKGYVYIGRLVDHNGNFVSDYRKLGKSIDFKTREINLNSTHLPIDVLFVRVFETNHMSSLEKVLHACYHEYRVVKEYDWRRNITTEWFDVEDEDLFNEKINSVIKYFPDTTEVDMVSKIQGDTGTTITYKTQMLKAVNSSRNSTKFELYLNGEDITESNAKLTMARAYQYVCEKIGWEKVDEDEFFITKDLNEYKERFTNYRDYMVHDMGNGYYMWASMANYQKQRALEKLFQRYGLNEIECKYEVIE